MARSHLNPPVLDSEDDEPGSGLEVPAGLNLTRAQAEAVIKRVQTALRVGRSFDENWKPDAIRGWEFYFGQQWTEDDADEVECRGQVPLVINEIKPTIDTLLGLQSVQPMDWLPRPKHESDEGITDSATAAMKKIADDNYADDVFSHAYFEIGRASCRERA